MRIRIHNRVDGLAVLRCERADGSATWQRHPAKNSRFFPPHDLTHYAVETTLGLRQAFYGLVADGWDLSDFGHPWPRGRLPAEANMAEFLVACVSQDLTTDEINAQGANFCGSSWREVTDDQLARVRTVAAELIAQWWALPPDGEIALEFTPHAER
ncbi:MAG TPA: hypothetical protein VFA43_18810 [Gemmatimonadaceae bacterium]|nr:hypothetical protein [Gemmatimonadaceae bacterium]